MTSAVDSGPASRREQRRVVRGATPVQPSPIGVRSARSQRQRRMSWMAIGVLLVVMSMLGFALWSRHQAQRTPVLVAGRDIAPGEVIERRDLVLIPVGADDGLAVLEAAEDDLVVGRMSRGPIPAGTPLSSALVVSEAVPAGGAVVGATLEAGDYPTGALQPGDRVKLVETAPQGSTGSEAGEVVELADGAVWTVEPLPSSSRQELFVSLLVAGEDAAAVSNAASAERLRLVLVGAAS